MMEPMSDVAISPRLVRQHVEYAIPLLAGESADGLLLFSPANILGFTGVPLQPGDRLVCGLLAQSGDVVLVCPAFEAPEPASLPPKTSVVTWQEHEDPYATTAAAAERIGLAKGTILLDPQTWTDAQRRISKALPKATLTEDPGLLRTVRITKSADEIEAIADSCRRVGRIYAQIAALIKPGITEIDLAFQAVAALGDNARLRELPMVQSGPNAAVPHRSTGERALAEGDCVIVDYYQPNQAYWGDMTRTFAVGRPDDEARRAYHAVRDAQRAAIAACRPGVECEDIDRAARKVIEDAGFANHFIHRLGHGIGLDGHEPPYLVRGNDERLAPGMCVTIEPGIYVPGKFGIRIEDVVTITDAGCRVLSSEVQTDVSDAFDQA